jgi:hypothetical protein
MPRIATPPRTSTIRRPRLTIRRWGARLACLAAACAALGTACAQAVPHDGWRVLDAAQRGQAAGRWSAVPAAPIAIVDVGSGGPSQRPRHALRMRFEGATRAMRSLGVEAEDCSSLLRSSTRMQASQPGGPERLRVSVSFAVNCRFF